MLRIIVSLLITLLVPIGYWFTGAEFIRGANLFFMYILCLLVFGFTMAYPGWEE